jgi:hypothetical protein
MPPAQLAQPYAQPRAQSQQRYRYYDSDEWPMYGHQRPHGKHKKRPGFLEELFD